jgi:UDP-glucose 4-epimerase
MTVLVTGASGRIGSLLCRTLVDRGEPVRALVLPDDPGAGRLEALGVDVVTGSLLDESLPRAVEGVRGVVHLGALLPQGADPDDLFRVNVEGTYRVLRAITAGATRLERMVFASTDDVYSAQAPRYLPIDEHHPRHPVSVYGLTKVLGEDLCHYFREREGVPIALGRFGLTQAAHELIDGLTAQYFLLSAHLRARRLADPDDQRLPDLDRVLARGEHAICLVNGEGRPWKFQICEVHDLVEGLVLLLDSPVAVGEVFNLPGAAPFTTDHAASCLAALTGLPLLEVEAPGPGLWFEESSARARSMLGYSPAWTIDRILEQAVADAEPGLLAGRYDGGAPPTESGSQ